MKTPNKISKTEIVFSLIFAFSVVLIVWQDLGMNKTLSLSPGKSPAPIIWSDNLNGGISISKLTIIDSSYQLDCKLRKKNDIFAYCGFLLPIFDNSYSHGIDLSSYDTIDLDISISSAAKDTVIVSLINKDVNSNVLAKRRVNSTTIYPNEQLKHFSLQLKSFSIPSWWLFNHPETSSGISQTDITNVTSVQITSGDNNNERDEVITIKNVKLRGKWISKTQLYFSLLCIWLIFSLIIFTIRLMRLSRHLQLSKKTEQELVQLNSFLSTEKEKFETMAKFDALTKAYNRAGIHSILDEAIVRLNKDKTPCALILFDIDYFKNINDTYGHQVGDDVLVGLSDYIRSHTRSDDYLMRWGGEEFILVCSNTQLEIAILLAEKLRMGISRTNFSGKSITCSFGVGPLMANDIQGSFKKLDEALYQAKNNGRNKVESL